MHPKKIMFIGSRLFHSPHKGHGLQFGHKKRPYTLRASPLTVVKWPMHSILDEVYPFNSVKQFGVWACKCAQDRMLSIMPSKRK
jgi:hypothetical protein